MIDKARNEPQDKDTLLNEALDLITEQFARSGEVSLSEFLKKAEREHRWAIVAGHCVADDYDEFIKNLSN